jgi:hypothetical protein
MATTFGTLGHEAVVQRAGTGPRSRRVAVVAAIAGGVGWLSKIVIMTAAGGPNPDSALEAISFFAGLGGVVIAAAAAGFYLARGTSAVRRVLAAIAAVVIAGVVVGIGQAGLSALPGDAWLQEEAVFGIVGLAALVAAGVAITRPAD